VRDSIRGYTDAMLEEAGRGPGPVDLTATATELAAVLELVDGSQDLRRALTDPGVPAPSRRALVTDLFEGRVGPATVRLLHYAIDADRATEWRDDVAWLNERIDAASHGLQPLGSQILGRVGAAERIDGFATRVLEQLEDRRAVENIEDELFRFMRAVNGSEELRTALSSRDLSAAARRSLVVDLLQSKALPATVRLAAYVAQVGRARDYEVLLAHLVDRVAAESNRRVAEVRSAVDLDDAQRGHLAEALSGVAGRAVQVRVTVDPAVLGGFVATIGDLVVDGSTRHRLNLLKERLEMPEAQITIGDPS